MKFSSTAILAATVFAAASAFTTTTTDAFTTQAPSSTVRANAVVSSVRPAFLNTQLFATTSTETDVKVNGASKTKKDVPAVPSTTSTEDLATEDEIRGLFQLWNDALATGDSRIVASRYAEGAVLLPTVSDTPRTDFDSIKDYFDAFLLQKPQGTK